MRRILTLARRQTRTQHPCNKRSRSWARRPLLSRRPLFSRCHSLALRKIDRQFPVASNFTNVHLPGTGTQGWVNEKRKDAVRRLGRSQLGGTQHTTFCNSTNLDKRCFYYYRGGCIFSSNIATSRHDFATTLTLRAFGMLTLTTFLG